METYFKKPYFRKVEVEIYNACNFKCWFCPNQVMTRGKSVMELDKFKKLITYLKNLHNLSIISLGGFGEPTLHKDILEIISYAKRQNRYKIHITTNGTKFLDKDFSLALLKTGIDKIMISLRITEPEKYKSNLPESLNYQEYIDSILNLVSLKYKYNINTTIQIALFKDSFYSKFFLKKNAGDLTNKNNINSFLKRISAIIKKPVPSYEAMTRSFLSKITNTSIYHPDKGLELELDSLSPVTSFAEKYTNPDKCLIAKHGACLGLVNHFSIFSSGIVSTCCADFDAKNNLGNIFEEKDIIKILSNEKSITFYKSLRAHKLPSITCQICRGGVSRLEKWGNFIGNMIFYNKFMIDKTAAKGWD